MKMSHAKLVAISGFVWFAIGSFLLPLGISLLMTGMQEAIDGVQYPVLSPLSGYVGGIEEAALFITLISLFIGYLKGRRILAKSVRRGVERIKAFPNPANLAKIYSPGYYILIGSMVAIGISIKFFGLSNDIRGAVDIAIGSALLNGAMLYFREAYQLSKVPVKK